MADLTVQIPALAGAALTYVSAAAGGDDFINNGRIMLNVKNAGGSPCTVTVNAQVNCNQGFDHDDAVVVPATTGDRWIGPFAVAQFNKPDDGKVYFTYSGVTSVTVAAMQC